MKKLKYSIIALVMLAILSACAEGGVEKESIQQGGAADSGEAVGADTVTDSGVAVGADTGTDSGVAVTESTGTDSGVAVTEDAGTDSGVAVTEDAGTDRPSQTFDVTMRDILEANRTKVLTASRGSFLMETNYAPELESAEQITEIYADGENIFLKTGTTQELYTNQGSYLFMDGSYGAALHPEPPDLSDFSMVLLDEELTSREDILSVEREGDTLTVRTVLSADALAEVVGPDLENARYTPGDSNELTYTLDASDLAVLNCSTILRRADGSSLDAGPMTVTYGADMPEDAVILREHMDAPDRRTVTVVLDPETPEEAVYSVTTRKGDLAFLFAPEGYNVFYKDPACTQVFEDEPNLYEDVTLYIPRTEDMDAPEETAHLAEAGEESLYDGASHRHAEDAERDMMEEEAARSGMVDAGSP